MREKEERREIGMDEIPAVQGSGAGAAGAGEQVACPKCGRLFNWIDLGWHVAACANSYPRIKTGETHTEITGEELDRILGGMPGRPVIDCGDEGWIQCRICGGWFGNESLLTAHQTDVHSQSK